MDCRGGEVHESAGGDSTLKDGITGSGGLLGLNAMHLFVPRRREREGLEQRGDEGEQISSSIEHNYKEMTGGLGQQRRPRGAGI